MWIWIGVGLLALGALMLVIVFALMGANMVFNREQFGLLFAGHLGGMVLMLISGLIATAGVGILIWQLIIYIIERLA